MKTFIHIEKPCKESWENMHELSGGRFCDLCSKKVLDLTQKSDAEILKIIEEACGKQICGHIYKNQLNRALLIPQKPQKISEANSFPYTKIAASVLLATSLVGNSCSNFNSQSKDNIPKTEQNPNQNPENRQEKDKIGNDFTQFSGKIIDETSQKPIENAKIYWITLDKIYTGFSDKNGNFSLEIPNKILHSQNVVELSFNDVKKTESDFFYYENHQKVIAKKDLNTQFFFKIKRETPYDGGISAINRNYDPTVFVDGEEIPYEDYQKLNFRNLEIHSFGGEIAKVLYPDVSADGLILCFTK